MGENQYEIYDISNATQCNSGASTAKSMKPVSDTTYSNSVLIKVVFIFGIVILLMFAGIIAWMHLIEVKIANGNYVNQYSISRDYQPSLYPRLYACTSNAEDLTLILARCYIVIYRCYILAIGDFTCFSR